MNRKPSEAPHRRLIAIAIVSVVTFLAANLFVSNVLATSGEKLRDLKRRQENLLDQNSRLRAEIIEKSALTALEDRAQKLGFVKSTQTLSISSQPPVAMHQQ
ncbi:hypothetical protein IH980_01315 [Patescibacteria group bacterium]|nr:hypothetical protein [Patescibacteria group bacterium]